MKTHVSIPLASLLAAFALAACRDTGPTAPLAEPLALEDQLALELLSDPSSAETALDIAGIQTSAAHRHGRAWTGSADLEGRARLAFQNARTALAQGDRLRAMEQARLARQLLAQAMEGAGGPGVLDALSEHLESLPLLVAAEPEAFGDAEGLGRMLGQLGRESHEARGRGDRTRAGELGLLGEQLYRQRQRIAGLAPADRAELVVALGAEAVELATRLLETQEGDMEQLDFLATAEEFQLQAEAALADGHPTRAKHLARLAEWWALKAVVLPGGITDEDIQQLVGLSASLVENATSALEADPDDLAALLLDRATRILEAGLENLEENACRGLGALWQAAVLSSYLLDRV